MRRVLLGCPSRDGRNDVRFTFSFGQSLRLCMAAGIDLRELFIAHDAIVQNARNDLVRAALVNNFDDLVMIDDDQFWTGEGFMRLLGHAVDVVGAPVRKKTNDVELYNVKVSGGARSFHDIQTDPATGLMTAGDLTLGSGFIRYSRKALTVLWENSQSYRFNAAGEEARWVFDIRPNAQGELISEDTAVCDKLRAHGITTWVDPAIGVGHVGTVEFTGDFAAWLARAKAQHPKPETAQIIPMNPLIPKSLPGVVA